MQLKSQLTGHEADTYPAQAFLDAPGAAGGSASLRFELSEYCRLVPVFFKLYFENHMISGQNFLLQCKLRLLRATFFFYKVQIFCARLIHGLPISDCWPKI